MLEGPLHVAIAQQKRAWQKGGASCGFSEVHVMVETQAWGRLRQLTPSIEGKARSFHEH